MNSSDQQFNTLIGLIYEFVSGEFDSQSRHKTRRMKCAYLSRQRDLAGLIDRWYFHCFSEHLVRFNL